ncbi:Rhodanese-like protein [Pseudovirgaria hyperparasitica]|uniref:Rhodanese-like protein n=1 Tax=Pseudovirgaria hyperparasitica TaxID=470096 RepID=A0A6A6WG78_9PEZI|nr:Rhodanese-like protein [Pseudovirgaria hyperparasitica]KAF2760627.1 Rhodanese-like protein [Pseudovirgaria hyperparasitica]
MSTSRSALRFLPRAASAAARRPCIVHPNALPQQAPPARRVSRVTVSLSKQVDKPRWYSSSSGSSKVYDYEAVQELIKSPSVDRVLIDVREPAEYDDGFIPTAINIPVKSAPDAIFMDPEEFEDKFGFQKPSPAHELVFYCKAGVRSSSAAQLARQSGYEKVGEYRGSWMDWVQRGGQTSKP